ncbi:MAG TPA: hypothetical protein EYG00_00085 [Alcanivorax sp.]|jgi:hypothetical protein|nr:hypothetical protein [Alcanivorax sp.]
MNEAQRQSYLRALGLTPWVARTTLPGAAPSEPLDWADETDAGESPAAPPVEATPVRTAPGVGDAEQPARETAPVAAVAEAPANRAPAPRDSVAETPARQPAPAHAAGLTFTLEAHLAGDTWVVFQQEDPQAPELGRYTGALAASLLAVFGAAPERPRRFYCPLTSQPMNAAEAAQALTAFFAGLSRQHGGRRALICADDTLARAVLGGERFQTVKLGEMPALAVDSLQEMLDRPAVAKKRSWQAMVTHGFAGSRG